jgi:dipeptidase E
MGNHPEHLQALVRPDERRAVVIANAIDDEAREVREHGVERELDALAALGFEPAELDLRAYFDREALLRRDLDGVGLVWARGGSAFLLRYALLRSGGDTIFRDLLAQDALVYAGYSAGLCVLAPTLRGLEAVDDPDTVTRVYRAEPVWDGLAIIDEAFIPHYRSPGHPETAAMERVVEFYRSCGMPYRTLRDGEAVVVDGSRAVLV